MQGFEPIEGLEMMPLRGFGGRSVAVFPYNHSYTADYSMLPFEKLIAEPLKEPYPNSARCRLCKADPVDYFSGIEVERLPEIDEEDYFEDDNEPINTIATIGAVFKRTCKNCLTSDDYRDIFRCRCNYGYDKTYIVPIGTKDLSIEPSEKKPLTLFQRFEKFIENSSADLEDINNAFIAGLLRSFGIVRDSVDFFASVGDILKQKLGIDKEKEKELCENPEISSQAIQSLKEISRPSNLELFRRMFPTGREIQEAVFNQMGIKHEPNTPLKRVLEELGASGPFGPLWMAISGVGQVAKESGLVNQNEKLFYEIGFAILCLKFGSLGKNIPTAKQVKGLSQSLAKADINLTKMNASEVVKAEKEVSKFVEALEKSPVVRSDNPSCIVFVDSGKVRSIQIANISHTGTFHDKGGLSKAARALQKKGSREGSVFPKPTGNVHEINMQGQKILDEMLNHPDKKVVFEYSPTLNNETLTIRLPDGRGARFTKDGKEMIGFLEPKI